MFYVYELCDPRDGIPFYCGKGQGERAYQHQREVANGTAKSNQAKINKILDILNSGYQVDVKIVANFDNEDDALYEEFLRVESNPNLTNKMPGGLSTGKASPIYIAKMDVKRLNTLLQKLEKSKSLLLNKPFSRPYCTDSEIVRLDRLLDRILRVRIARRKALLTYNKLRYTYNKLRYRGLEL